VIWLKCIGDLTYTFLGNMFTPVALSYIVDPYPHAGDRKST
jgi:hypothetical protein